MNQIPVAQPCSVIVKIVCSTLTDRSTRRFSLSPISFHVLLAKARTKFEFEQELDLEVTYVDEEGDTLVITTEHEFFEALRNAQENKRIPKFEVSPDSRLSDNTLPEGTVEMPLLPKAPVNATTSTLSSLQQHRNDNTSEVLINEVGKGFAAFAKLCASAATKAVEGLSHHIGKPKRDKTIEKLIEMGFKRDESTAAAFQSRGKLEPAVDLLVASNSRVAT